MMMTMVTSISNARSYADLFETFELYNENVRQWRQTEWFGCSSLKLTASWTEPTITANQLQSSTTAAP